MKQSAWTSLALFALLLGCSADPPRFVRDGGDGGSGDGGSDAGPGCQRGQWVCRNGGTEAVMCDGMGGTLGTPVTCPAGQSCVALIGCVTCSPRQQRCNPSNPQQTQVCSDDGTQWINGAICDDSRGQTCSAGRCQDRCATSELNYLGCEYWPTITANSQLDTAFPFAVVVANPQSYSVTLNVTGGRLSAPINRTLMPGEVQTIQLPNVDDLIQNVGMSGCGGAFEPPCIAHSALVTGGAYHIQANGPIAAYQFNPLTFRSGSGSRAVYSYTNDASLLLPTHVLTTHYIVGTHNNWTARDPMSGNPVVTLGGFIAVVGVDPAETGTDVTVRLTGSISGGPGVSASSGAATRTFNLRQGDVLQLVGSAASQDLTGTVIESSRPVAVFVGHDCTNMPDDRPACDHLEEQLLPSATWGRRYAVTQLRVRGATEPHRVRLIAQRANTSYTFDGIPAPRECSGTYAAGQFCEFQTTGNFVVSGSQPFLTLQFMVGQGQPDPSCFDPFTGQPTNTDNPICMGDPAMVTEIPVEQFRRSYDFLVPSTYSRNMINVVAPEGAVITLDGVRISGSSTSAGTGYIVYFIPITEGRHHIEADSDDHRFGLKVYGIASYTSYMYPGGLDLDLISPPG